MIPAFQLNQFTSRIDFPFHIHYGQHQEDMFIHTHEDFSELVIILNGTATHLVNQEEYPIKKGDVFVINENTSHGFLHPRNFRLCNIMFRPSFFLPLLSDIRTSPGFHALFLIEPTRIRQDGFQGKLSIGWEDFDETCQLIEKIHAEYYDRPEGYQTMITSLLSQLVTRLSRLYQQNSRRPGRELPSLAIAVAYIENHFAEELSVDELASLAGMSVRHFRRLFQDVYNTSPVRYINSLRIQAAKRLLLNSDLSITDIAMHCGFVNGNYFSTRFKKATGQSPYMYRSGRLQEAYSRQADKTTS